MVGGEGGAPNGPGVGDSISAIVWGGKSATPTTFWASRPPKVQSPLHFGPLDFEKCKPLLHFWLLELQKCNPYCILGSSTSKSATHILGPVSPRLALSRPRQTQQEKIISYVWLSGPSLKSRWPFKHMGFGACPHILKKEVCSSLVGFEPAPKC